jgi:undecaprenyl diphosphate synthase
VTENRRIPEHVAIIMDGNGRWAQSRGLPRNAGHKEGAETVRRVVEAAADAGVKYLTLFGFSTENWNRPADEVSALMMLMRHYMRGNVAELHEKGVRLRVIGERHRLEPDVLKIVESAEETTRGNNRVHLTIAFSYGARQELVNAAQKLAFEVQAGRLRPEEIDQTRLGHALLTADLPDPDLLIRTSGEKRISNFLLWQLAYTELVFLDTLWPDFSRQDLDAAINEFNGRQRRYGGLTSSGTRA